MIDDANAGTLANLSFVIPQKGTSQHNGSSMLVGDNWIGDVVGAIMNGPDWSSSAIFITYDDCGCFYDHVTPPPGANYGVRVPFVIVSPCAKPGFTDSTVASFGSGRWPSTSEPSASPLSEWDATAYDYSSSFDYSQSPLPPIALIRSSVPAREIRCLTKHPPPNGRT